MTYQIAEKFKSIQGEGVYAGTPMAFIRFTGCSVGKTICNFCDTDFEYPVTWRGGGEFTIDELAAWVGDHQHVCLTGGEPFDQSLIAFEERFTTGGRMLHIESSGTKHLTLSDFAIDMLDGPKSYSSPVWLCVSPKPGWKEEIIELASEVKVIMPGLGKLQHGIPVVSDRGRWPQLEDALRWADNGKIVFIQPKNDRNDVDMGNLRLCQDIVAEYPQLRLSVQLHKILRVQ